MSDFDDPDLDIDLTPPVVGAQYHPAETEEVLLQLRDVIEAARPVPLSASSMIAKEDVLELVDEALQQLPEELRAARWLLKEREEFLARTRHEADEMLDQARARAERMVQRTEVVKAAEQRAYEIVDAAQADARRLRHEVEDFCDQKLASFEIVLDRTQKLVTAGRSKLQGTNLLAEAAAAAVAEGGLTETEQDLDDMTSGHPSGGGAVADPSGYSDRATYGAAQGQADHAADAGFDDVEDDDHDDDPYAEGRTRQGRLQVVDERYSDLPPPPPSQSETLRDAAATFFDQDLA
jgi:cell division septum initiation protein DivIVA